MPSALIRWSFIRSSRVLTESGREEATILNRRWTAFETLLTFWPPDPCARIAVIATSRSFRTKTDASWVMEPLVYGSPEASVGERTQRGDENAGAFLDPVVPPGLEVVGLEQGVGEAHGESACI